MASVQTLYSGSSGNCTIVRDDTTVILVDMGKSCKQTINALYELNISVSDITAVFVTHEHSDHIAGLFTFMKYHKKPLYGSPITLGYLKHNGLIPDCAVIEIEPDELITVGSIGVKGFRTSHDSFDCYGYRFYFNDGKSVAIAKDLGNVNEELIQTMSGCSFVGIEANYDNTMLWDGVYPQNLKMRIASEYGHLSNTACSSTIVKLASSGTDKFMLMHLSLQNNQGDIALTNVYSMLEDNGIENCDVYVAPRDEPSIRVEV